MLIGTFVSAPCVIEGEIGQYLYDVEIDRRLIELSGAARNFIMSELAASLAGLIERYQIPQDLWAVEITPEIQNLTGLPAAVRFGV